MVASLIWFIAVGIVVIYTGWMPLFVAAAAPVVGWLSYRRNLVGDEDELRAGFFGEVARDLRAHQQPAEVEEERDELAEWLDTIPAGYHDVPLPPVAEQQDGRADRPHGG